MVVPVSLLTEQRTGIHAKPGFINSAAYTQCISFLKLSYNINQSTIQIGLRHALFCVNMNLLCYVKYLL